MTMATAEFVGVLTAMEPNMFKPASDPEQEEAPEESQQQRMNMDVYQWLVVNSVTSTLLLCYCRPTKVLRAYWPHAPCCYR